MERSEGQAHGAVCESVCVCDFQPYMCVFVYASTSADKVNRNCVCVCDQHAAANCDQSIQLTTKRLKGDG